MASDPRRARESDSTRLRNFTRYVRSLPAKPPYEQISYRGFQVGGVRGGNWYVEHDPRIYKSKKAALAAVDRCLALRAELGE